MKFFSPLGLKVLSIVVCSLLLFFVTVLRSPSTAEEFMLNTLDHSWIISLAHSLQDGQVSGRDFQYTYGVAAQVLARLAVALNPSDSALYGFFSILLVYRSATLVFLGLALALIKQVNWKYVWFIFLMFALLNGLFHYAAVRMLLILLTAVFLQRAMAGSDAGRRRIWAMLTGGLGLGAQLFTAELGLYLVVSATITLSAYAIFSQFRGILGRDDLRSPRCYLVTLAIIVGIWLAGNLIVSLIFKVSSPDYQRLFDYQWYTLEIIRGYNATMGLEWRPPLSFLRGLALIVLYVSIFVLSSLRRLEAEDGYLLFGLLIAALFALKGLMLRSDWGHLILAFVPMIFLLLLIGLDRFQTKYSRPVWLAALLLLFAWWPGADFTALKHTWGLLSGEISLRSKLKQIIYYQEPLDKFLSPELTDAMSEMPGALLAFPYQNYIPIGAGRDMVAPVLQSFIAHTEALQRMYIQQLRREDDLRVVYGLDALVSFPVDGVQNISRIPRIFEYLYRNFELQSSQTFDQGYYLLRPRAAPVEFQRHPLAYATDESQSARVVVQLQQPAACSLVQLTMTMRYPMMWGLTHPSPVVMQFFNDDVKLKQTNVVAVETGAAFSTYVSLLDPQEFYRIFGNAPASERTWTTLRIEPHATGPFGVSPNGVAIDAIECVTFNAVSPN